MKEKKMAEMLRIPEMKSSLHFFLLRPAANGVKIQGFNQC